MFIKKQKIFLNTIKLLWYKILSLFNKQASELIRENYTNFPMHYLTLCERVNTKGFHGVDKVACGRRTDPGTTGCAEIIFFTRKRFEILMAATTSKSKLVVRGSSETSVSSHQATGCHMQKEVKIKAFCVSVTG